MNETVFIFPTWPLGRRPQVRYDIGKSRNIYTFKTYKREKDMKIKITYENYVNESDTIFCEIKMAFICKNRIVEFDVNLSSSYEEHKKNNE